MISPSAVMIQTRTTQLPKSQAAQGQANPAQVAPAPVINQPQVAVANQAPAPQQPVLQQPQQPAAPAAPLPVAAPPKAKQGYFAALASAGQFRNLMQTLSPQLQQALQNQNYSQALAILQQMLAAYNALSSTAQSIVGNNILRQIGSQIASVQQLLNQQIGNGIKKIVQIATAPIEPDNSQPVGEPNP
jgi:hypothetical protein